MIEGSNDGKTMPASASDVGADQISFASRIERVQMIVQAPSQGKGDQCSRS
jgi:hypothetical protein